MSKKEVNHAQVLDMLKGSKISRQEASKRMVAGLYRGLQLAFCSGAKMHATRTWPAPAELVRTLSVQVTKTLSKNLSRQHENQWLQVETTGTGLGLRGAKVTVHEHFDGMKELLWRKRKLAYSVMEKPRRNTMHKPAPDHPWRNMPIGKPANDGRCATL